MDAPDLDGNYDALVRPFQIRLKKEGALEVTDIVFMGEMAEVMLETLQGPLICQCMSTELADLGIKKGMKVGIQIKEGPFSCFAC